jgi:hypothetical protein
MIRGKGHYRKPDPLMLLAAAVVLGAVVTTAALAAETFNFFARSGTDYRISPQANDGFSVASLGEAGAGLRVSLTPPREHSQDYVGSRVSTQAKETFSHVFFFLRYPW